MRGEVDIEDIREAFHHHPFHLLTQERGKKATLLELRVATVDERGDDRRVGRWTTDAQPLQLFDQTGLGVAGRRLREMLRRSDRPHRNVCALLYNGKSLLFLERFSFLCFARLLVQPLVAIEFDDAAGGPEQE